MQHVSITTFLVSCLLMSGCSGQHLFTSTEVDNRLPSLQQYSSSRVIQVAANFDKSVQRDHPYFIVCDGDYCPVITAKTPLNVSPIKTASSLQSKGRTVAGVNTTYMKKKLTMLEQFRVHFDYASAELSKTYQSLLRSFVDDYPHKQESIRVTGYTDSGSKPDGTVGNEWLALERAISVKNELIDLGYPESQVLLEAKFLCCYIDSNESEAGRRNNRRAEITLIQHF